MTAVPEPYSPGDVKEQSDTFIGKLHALTELTSKNKLGISSSGSLFIEYLENGKVQAWWRKITNQSRYHINDYLKRELHDYHLFLLFLVHLTDHTTKDSFLKGLRETHIGFLANVNQGLSILSATYSEYDDMMTVCNLYRRRFNESVGSLERGRPITALVPGPEGL